METDNGAGVLCSRLRPSHLQSLDNNNSEAALNIRGGGYTNPTTAAINTNSATTTPSWAAMGEEENNRRSKSTPKSGRLKEIGRSSYEQLTSPIRRTRNRSRSRSTGKPARRAISTEKQRAALLHHATIESGKKKLHGILEQ